MQTQFLKGCHYVCISQKSGILCLDCSVFVSSSESPNFPPDYGPHPSFLNMSIIIVIFWTVWQMLFISTVDCHWAGILAERCSHLKFPCPWKSWLFGSFTLCLVAQPCFWRKITQSYLRVDLSSLHPFTLLQPLRDHFTHYPLGLQTYSFTLQPLIHSTGYLLLVLRSGEGLQILEICAVFHFIHFPQPFPVFVSSIFW